MPYPIPNTKTAWERAKKMLTIYSRAPGANIENIRTFIDKEEHFLAAYIPIEKKLLNYELAFDQVNKFFTTRDNKDWKIYYQLRDKCTPDEQEALDEYVDEIQQKQIDRGDYDRPETD